MDEACRFEKVSIHLEGFGREKLVMDHLAKT